VHVPEWIDVAGYAVGVAGAAALAGERWLRLFERAWLLWRNRKSPPPPPPSKLLPPS
jgi:hypothetical protein